MILCDLVISSTKEFMSELKDFSIIQLELLLLNLETIDNISLKVVPIPLPTLKAPLVSLEINLYVIYYIYYYQ